MSFVEMGTILFLKSADANPIETIKKQSEAKHFTLFFVSIVVQTVFVGFSPDTEAP